jgi:hypothetical protein
MRSTSIIGAVLALASTTLAQMDGMTSMTKSMVPMATPSAPPVTMAWNDEPTKENGSPKAANETPMASGSKGMDMGMDMGMGGSMTMSDGTVMATGAMAEMAGTDSMTGNAVSHGAWGGVVVGAFGVGVAVVAGML